MNDNEKMWYSIPEAAVYLNIEMAMLQRKIIGLSIETRSLPGEKGEFLGWEDVRTLDAMINGPQDKGRGVLV